MRRNGLRAEDDARTSLFVGESRTAELNCRSSGALLEQSVLGSGVRSPSHHAIRAAFARGNSSVWRVGSFFRTVAIASAIYFLPVSRLLWAE